MLLGDRASCCSRRFVDLVCGLIILGLAWRVWIKAGKIAGYGDTTEVLRMPVGPFVYFMALMVAVTGIVHLGKVVFPAPADAAAALRPEQERARHDGSTGRPRR